MMNPPTTTREAAADTTANPHGGQALITRIRFLCAMAVSATIFWYVGWWVAAPFDPGGPVSLLMIDRGVVAMAELLGLAVVSSGLAVVICAGGTTTASSGWVQRGPLAVAVGLATLGLRGAQLDRLVNYRLNPPAGTDPMLDPVPVWALAAECWLWLALIAVGFVVGRWIEDWFGAPLAEPPAAAATADPSARPSHVSVYRLSRASSEVRQGLGTLVVAALVAWTVLSFTIGGEPDPILKGQVYFSLALSFLAGALVAHWFFRTTGRGDPISPRLWALAAVAVVATVGYAVGEPDNAILAAARKAGTYVTLRPLARPLPIEFASMGAVGVLLEGDVMRSLRAMFGLGPDGAEKRRPDDG